MTDQENISRATVTWVDGLQMVAESDSGHAIVLDGAPGFGRDTGVRPMELLLLGLAGCTGMDVVHILGKRRVAIERFQVQVTAHQSPDHPKVYTAIEIAYHVTGPDIRVKDLEMAIEMSATAFCAASDMLGKAARITHTYCLDGAEGRREAALTFK